MSYLYNAKFINKSGRYNYIVQYTVKNEAAKIFDRTNTAKFSLYVSPYLVANQGGRYTKHIYVGSQRIVSKLGDFASYGSDPRRIPYAGSEADAVNVDYKGKYASQQQVIKDNYTTFNVPYNGEDNNDYVAGEGFCCNDGTPEAAQAKAMASNVAGAKAISGNFKENDDYEKMQFYYHPDHLGSSSYITNLDGEVAQHIEYVPFGEVFIEERNNTWNTPYLFNAKEFDQETGLYYYGARYYEPRLGLWMSVDRFTEKYPQLTSYNFCASNPIILKDLNGDSLWISYKKENYLYQSNKLYNKDGSPYEGEIKGFLKEAKEAIDIISGTDSGSNLLNRLETSKNNIYIKNDSKKNHYTPFSSNKASLLIPPENSKYAQIAGSGGNIYWGPHNLTGGPDEFGETHRPAFIGLAHELGHAHAANEGKSNLIIYNPKAQYPLNAITKDDYNAMHFENMVRYELGYPIRIAYTYDENNNLFFRYHYENK